MDFAKKRKLNALLNGLGSRPSYPTDSIPPAPSDTAPEDESTPQTPPPNRTSTNTLASASSNTRTPGSDSMAMRTSVSSVPRSATSTDLDLLTKRRRLGLADSTPSKDLNTKAPDGGSQTTISNIVLRKWGGNKEKETIFKPKYCPGDREELLKRLASFQELTDWTPKPNPVAEVQWAKRGWICQGKERVRCTLCNKELVVKLNRKEVDGKEVPVLVPSEIEDALVAKYVELIVTSHQDDCLWRKRGCDDSLLRLPLSNRQAAIQDLRRRYDELCARRDFLPYEFNLRLPARLDIDTVLRYLPREFFTAPEPPPANPPARSPNRVALALAILGWQGLSNARIGPVPNTASCHTCLRRLGLWMFKSKEVDPDSGAVLVPAPMDYLDPLREHRFFCPWNSADAQRITSSSSSDRRRAAAADGGGEEDRPGWEVLLQVLKNEAYLRSRDSPASGRRGDKRASQTPSSRRSGQDAGGAEGRGGEDGEGGGEGDEDEEDEKTQNAKDKERWKRLRRVKSLLSSKGTNKLRKSITLSRPGSSAAKSRPGTSHSTAQGGDGAPQGGDSQSGEAA
ncbi:c3hc zinc finger domain-containing protein [Diaporthe amygdali]|uniref:c3hc zinc finger domain-containing protein n=1 Tax=Phomopsis amygdali TaxID=1214568 RepID=UPI0022FEAFA3|nr:c3hc zinc finger domain-containing protein [Diaporthe amygdali]KAJ0119428.1 c3hc zinc finger domain-containing protein [Diaporthe amygdali]